MVANLAGGFIWVLGSGLPGLFGLRFGLIWGIIDTFSGVYFRAL